MNLPSEAPLAPAIDADAIRTYCTTVFGYLDGLVPVRFLSEQGTSSQPPQIPFVSATTLAEYLIANAQWAADEQRAVFVVPGTVAEPGQARAADIVQTGVLLIDIDQGDIAAKREHLVRHLGRPSLEVASGGVTADGQDKLHLYWRLKEPAEGPERQGVAEFRAALAAKVNGDPAFGSLHQPIRVAGTVHGKSGIQTPVRLLAHHQVEYELDDLADAIAAMPAMSGVGPDAARERGNGPSAAELATRIIRAGGKDDVTRFESLSKVIGHWIRCVRTGQATLAEAWTAVEEHNAAMIVPPWDQAHLRREFNALLKKDIADKGPMPQEPAAHRQRVPAFSDDALAADFVARHGPEWRYVAALGGWHHWNGHVWQRDETGLVLEQARQVCRAAALHAEGLRQARSVASHKTIKAVLSVARSDPALRSGKVARARGWQGIAPAQDDAAGEATE